MNSRTYALLFGMVAAAGCAGSAPPAGEQQHAARILEAAPNSNPVLWAGTFRSENFTQRIRHADEILWEETQSLFIENTEVDPGTGQSYAYTLEFQASFVVTDVRYRCANDFLVIGREPRGATVLERWLVAVPDGGWDAPRAVADTALGVPVHWFQPPQASLVGGTFIPPGERGVRPTTRRTRLHRVPVGETIYDGTLDPDARFALFTDGSGVYRVFLDGEAADPELVPGTDTLPIGTFPLSDISYSHHRTLGRFVRLRAAPVDYEGLLVDADNDGVYENLWEFDADTIKDLPAGWMLPRSY